MGQKLFSIPVLLAWGSKEEKSRMAVRVGKLPIPHWCISLPQVPIKSYYFVSQVLLLRNYFCSVDEVK